MSEVLTARYREVECAQSQHERWTALDTGVEELAGMAHAEGHKTGKGESIAQAGA